MPLDQLQVLLVTSSEICKMLIRNILTGLGWFTGCILMSYICCFKCDNCNMAVGVMIGSIIFAPWTEIVGIFRQNH
jgi:hypothetical protein